MKHLTTTVDHLFAGGLGLLEPEGHLSGIFKRRVRNRVRVEVLGIVGDEHADTRMHGGPEKAVHQYAAENYARLAQAYPHAAEKFVPGSIGENVSAHSLAEHNVHIGDIFRMGSAVVQVSQPRSPCWKINHRFGAETMSLHVAQHRMTGWYYRVIDPGSVEMGDQMTLLDRPSERFSIAEFWEVQSSHRPCMDDLEGLLQVHGLAPEWRQRLVARAEWLATHHLRRGPADNVNGQE